MIPSLVNTKGVRFHLDKVLFGLSCLYLGGVLVWLAMARDNSPAAQKPTLSSENARFIAYLEKSLEVIERQQKPAVAPNPAPAPAVAVAPPVSVNAPPVVQRIYVPVYPTPAAVPPVGSVSPVPLLPPPSSVAPVPTPITSVPVLTPGKVLLPTNVNHTLVGVLELGDRSVALFDSQGITKRLTVGEMVGDWRVVRIENQQVMLSRQGMAKALNVGQSF